MSAEAIRLVLDHSQSKGTARLVLLVLAERCNGARGDLRCWPSLVVLAQETGLNKSNLCRALTHLEETVREVCRKRSNGGWNSRTEYLITVKERQSRSDNEKQWPNDTVSGDEQQWPNDNKQWPNDTVNSVIARQALNRNLNRKNQNNSVLREKRAHATPDPRVKTVLTAFVGKYHQRAGAPYVVVAGKDPALIKRLLSAGYDDATIEVLMDRYFADPFYSKIGFDVGGFVKAFNRLKSSGVRKKHGYTEDFPEL